MRAGRWRFQMELEGVARIDQPDADRLTVRRYSSANGLASEAVRGFAEDRFGRIYVGTSRGVSRIVSNRLV